MRTKYLKSVGFLASAFILLGSISNASAIRPNTGAGKVAPGKANPKAIVADNGAGKVAPNKANSKSKAQTKNKSKKHYSKGTKAKSDPRKGIIEPVIFR